MISIAKCDGEGCPLRNRCVHYYAPLNIIQFVIRSPYKDGKCKYFWDIGKEFGGNKVKVINIKKIKPKKL